MMVSDKNKIAYIAIPKTGTRSMYHILKTEFGGKISGDHRKKIPEYCNKFFVFTTIRNPYDRICSAYWSTCMTVRDQYRFKQKLKKHKLDNTLANYLHMLTTGKASHITANKQVHWIRPNKIDKIIKQENLEEEFNKLPFVKKPYKLPNLNSSRFTKNPSRPPTDKLLTKKSIDMINEFYKEDFEALKYPVIKSVREYKKIYGKK